MCKYNKYILEHAEKVVILEFLILRVTLNLKLYQKIQKLEKKGQFLMDFMWD